MKNIVLVSAVLLALFGCAPMPVNLASSDNFVNRQAQNKNRLDYKLVVINRAAQTKTDVNMFAVGTFPINKRIQVDPQATLESDIKKGFENVTERTDNYRRIVARIDKADAYWVSPAVNGIPLIGLFTMYTSNYPFVFDISVTFEVEENGKVVNSWPFTQKVEIQDGNGATPGGIEESYQRLVAKYRKVMFDSINDEFIPRYLSNSPIAIPLVKN